nr:hypothetical protein [Candidatus Sigynarchaeum springense]
MRTDVILHVTLEKYRLTRNVIVSPSLNSPLGAISRANVAAARLSCHGDEGVVRVGQDPSAAAQAPVECRDDRDAC